MNTTLIIILSAVAFITLIIIIPILWIKSGEWNIERRHKKFKKLYPNIYKMVDDYTIRIEELHEEYNKLAKHYRANCDKIADINKLLPNIPNDSERYKCKYDELTKLKTTNNQILDLMEENQQERKDIYPLSVQIAHIFYSNYTTHTDYTDIDK